MAELPLPPLPGFFMDMILEDASTPKRRYAVRFLTRNLFLPIESEPIPIQLPDGRVVRVEPTHAVSGYPTREYWRVWREADSEEEAIKEARGFLSSNLHNMHAMLNALVAHPWHPIQVVRKEDDQLSVLGQWDTPEEGETELGKSRKEIYDEFTELFREHEGRFWEGE
ncbi:MAG: hypothetical protein ABIH46_07440 [Chloroflexota bacterium]